MASNVQACQFCGRCFTDMAALDQHEMFHRHGSNENAEMAVYDHSCEFCDQRFTDTVSLYQHQSLHGSVSNENSDVSLSNQECRCTHCNKCYKTKTHLNAHMKAKHTGTMHSRSKCSKTFSFATNKSRHEKTCKGTLDDHTKSKQTATLYACSKCTKTFSVASNKTRHEKTCKGTLDHTKHQTATTHACSKCSKTFSVATNKSRHEKTCKGTLDAHTKSKQTATLYSCSKCTKTFCVASNKTRHEKTCKGTLDHTKHQTATTHACSKCSKTFSVATNKSRHEKTCKGTLDAHTKSKQTATLYSCSKCTKTFCVASNKTRHEKTCKGTLDHTKHQTATTHACSKCSKTFSVATNKSRHEKTCKGTLDAHTKSKQTATLYSCSKCTKTFCVASNKTRHEKNCKGTLDHTKHQTATTHACSKCSKTFSFATNKTRHEKSCDGFGEHVCDVCNKRCATAAGLKRHKSIHAPRPQTPSATPNPSDPDPTIYHCRYGLCPETFDNRRDLYLHGMREHYQRGGGLQSVPWGNKMPPWQRDDGTIDQDLRETYEANSPIILQQHRLGPVQNIYNFPVNNDIDIPQIMDYAREIYNQQHHAFRLNLVFGTILRHRETGQYRYFTPYGNNAILERPLFISRRADLQRLQLRLRRMDITTELLRNRPDTKWVPQAVTNLMVYVYSTHYPVGVGNLPQHLMVQRSIYPLVKNQQNAKLYKDNLCAFRCLALHKGYDIKSIEGPAAEFYRQWSNSRKSGKDFHGVSLEEFPEFERLFKINLEVYSLDQHGHARSVYKSRGRFDATMYANLHEHHLSYIKNFSLYANKYQCKTCDRHFKTSFNLHRHQPLCSSQTKFVYPGGFHQTQESIFEKLEHYGIDVPRNERSFPWFLCYDFEAMLQRVNDSPTDTLHWTQKHIPISVAICSNVEGHREPVCIVEPDQDVLIQNMVTTMRDMAFDIYELAEEKWGWVLEEIDDLLRNQQIEDDTMGSEGDDDDDDNTQSNPLLKLHGQMEGYMTQVPVVGFNSAKYDLNLVKANLAKHLNLHDKEMRGTFVVKKNNAYTCIATEHLKFLDMSQFLAAGSSYTTFLKAYHVQEMKAFFPYEWLTDIDKLTHPALPPHEAFHSSLKDTNITEAEYEWCQQQWNENNMTTFEDFLKFYNCRDVGPFVTAIERFQDFYFQKDIDVFKTAISVPGIARQLLFKAAKKQNASFALFDDKNSDLYETIKQNIIGGPSVIFNRHQKAGETTIHGGKTCRSICGFDANALYLQAIGQPMPVGPFVRRRLENNFHPEVRDQYMMAYYWLDWLIQSQNLTIHHKLNRGSEVRVGQYPVDGFSPASRPGDRPIVYQFHGCYWHGHDCQLTTNIKNDKWRATREQKYRKTAETTKYIRDQGYVVIEMWECEFKRFCQQHPGIYPFIDTKRPDFFLKHKGQIVSENDILNGVVNDDLFGMVEVDIEVPENWPQHFQHESLTPYQYFEEMSPLFCTTDIPFEAFGNHMQDHVNRNNLSKEPRRLLVGGMKARQILLASTLLKWYINHGMVVTKIYQVVEFQAQRCFKEFVQEVTEARRKGDADPDTAIIADTMKVIGNSSYGSLIMDKTKHREIKYIQGENETCLKVNDPRFRKLECLDEEDQFYEMEMAKKRIRLDLPIQLGYFILQYAKLRMLEFYYDFVDIYVGRDQFSYSEMDTDSAYMAISGSSLDDVIKPEMMEKYQHGLKGFCNDEELEADADCHWFPRTCCSKHAKFDKRTPGLFKLEFQGDEMIGLCSKTYIVRKSRIVRPSSAAVCAYKLLRRYKGLKPRPFNSRSHISNAYKFSSKGISKRNIKAPMSIFRQVLKTGKSRSGTNRGFRARQNTIFTYTQERRGFSYFYCKRKVLDDGIHTVPLDMTLCPIPPKPMDAHDQELVDILVDLLEESTD